MTAQRTLIRSSFITLATAMALATTAMGLSSCSQEPAGKEVKLETTLQKASYSYGVDMAKRLQQQGVELDMDALTTGIIDVTEDKPLALDDDARRQAMADFQTELRESLVRKQEEIAANNLAEGKAFLEENGKKPGVITTPSGLQYKVLTSGDGPKPEAGDTVTTHYRGTLIDGREFDSSYSRNRPASFPVQGVIKGWTEALQMMSVGDKWQLFVPSELAYGATKRSELIQANSTLIFEIELLGIEGKEEEKEAEKDSE